MSTGMQGLDPQDCREFAKLLTLSAQKLDRTAAELAHSVNRARWHGPDSQQFRAKWPTDRKILMSTARELEDLAKIVLRNVAEQERASAVEGEGIIDRLVDGAKDLWDDFTDGVGNAVDGVKDFLGDVGEGIQNSVSWLVDHIDVDSILSAANTGADHLLHFGGLVGQIFSGNPPTLSALFASGILVLGSSFSTGVTVLTGGHLNFNLFNDGSPYAGTPIPVTSSSDNPLQRPDSISAIFGGVEDAYAVGNTPEAKDGDLRIVKVEQPDGSVGYIINIPGTEDWGTFGSGKARDLTSNFMLVAGQSTSAQEAIALAMQKAGVPAGANVMLVGHSQGGILASSLGSDPAFLNQYNVTNILTAGAPIDGTGIDPSIKVLATQHQGDLVPKLDLGGFSTHLQMPGTPPNVTLVTMDDPPRDTLGNVLHYSGSPIGQGIQAFRDIGQNHETGYYRSDLANTGKYPDIATYQNDESMKVFISTDESKVTAVDVPVGRR